MHQRLQLGLSTQKLSSAVDDPATESETLIVDGSNIFEKTLLKGKPVKNWNKIGGTITGITFTGTLSACAIELNNGGGWLTGSTDYYKNKWKVGATDDWGDGANIPIVSDAAATELYFEIWNLGLAVPSHVRAWDLKSGGNGYFLTGQSSAAEIHTAFRLVFTGAGLDVTGGNVVWGVEI